MTWSTAAPYVAASVALLVGVGSAILASRTARKTFEHQRELSREQRLWEKRADTYVAVLEWTQETAAAVFGDEPSASAGANVPTGLAARVGAYASARVQTAFRHCGC
jgi:hypothetical protein